MIWMLMAGPEVPLKGSPTVSPTTVLGGALDAFDHLLGIVPAGTTGGSVYHATEHESSADGS